MTLQELRDKRLETQIELNGLEMQIAVRIGLPDTARQYMRNMEELIGKRSPEQIAKMEKERGLS